MSLSTLSSNKLQINPRTICLVYGYIRMIDIKDKIVPSSIMNLCVIFYYSKSRIIYIKQNQSYSSDPSPKISIADIDANKHYQCNIKLQNKNESITYLCDSNCGVCYVKDFQLPSYVTDLNNNMKKNGLYDIIFVVQNYNKNCNAYIIDPLYNHYGIIQKKINTYYWTLPSFD